MSTKAIVLKLLHLGEIWKCRKTKGWATARFRLWVTQEIPGRDKACAKPVSRQKFLCRDTVLRPGEQRQHFGVHTTRPVHARHAYSCGWDALAIVPCTHDRSWP